MSFVDLPDDVIRHHIFPLLPVAQRMELNVALPSSYRIKTPLCKEKCLSFELSLAFNRLSTAMNTIAKHISPFTRRKLILRWFRSYKDYLILTQYNIEIRNIFIGRLKYFAGTEDMDGKTPHFIRTMGRLYDEIMEALTVTYPYKEEKLLRRSTPFY
jgi:hypothetical protein